LASEKTTMMDSAIHGPIDFVLIEFASDG